jgi:hypothetical protein
MTTKTLSGGCLCGAVRYEVSSPVTELRACHCTHCQRTSGTGGSVNAVVPRANFKLVKGDPKRYADTAQSGRKLMRHFCADCGAPIYSFREATPEMLVVRAGTLDDSLDVKITTHIWTASARPWDQIDPGAERHPGNLPPKA